MTREEPPCIMYFGNDWGTDNHTSSHHIARRLAERYRLYYIECPGLRGPKRSKRDFKKVWKKLWRFARGTRQASPRIKVRTLLQIPFHRFKLVRSINNVLVNWSLRWFMYREGIRNPIVWFVVPHLAPVVGKLPSSKSVYYCTDDYATLPDVDEKTVRAFDDALTRKADVVFVTAESLKTNKLPINSNTHFSPHGVDFELFSKACDPSLPVPEEFVSEKRPIIGFIGLIEGWIDFDLIDFLAASRPDWTFAFIGRVAVSRDRLPQRPNVKFLGQKPYNDLPAFGRQFDVTIIPFLRTPVIMHANPLKLREYLAMGKPVVSVSTPEIDKFADVIEIAHSKEEFLEKLELTLKRPTEPAEVQRRLDRVASSSWEARVEEIIRVVGL